VGFNYRLTNIQAALGVAQLELLEVYLAAKRRIAATYDAELADLPGLTPMREAPWAESAMWMYTVLVDPDRFGMGSRALLQFLSDRNIQTRPLWQPIHRSRAHRDARGAHCPVAERLNRDALSLPCSVGLTEEQQARVIAAVREAVVGAAVSAAQCGRDARIHTDARTHKDGVGSS